MSNGGARRSGQASRAPSTRGCRENDIDRQVQQAIPGAEEYLDRLAALEPFSPQEVVAWLGIRLDKFPAWAFARLESELASINELARTSRDNEEAAALVRQIDHRIGEAVRTARRCHFDTKSREQREGR